MLNIIFISLMIIAASSSTFPQGNYKTRAEKLHQLKNREDIKVTEVGPVLVQRKQEFRVS